MRCAPLLASSRASLVDVEGLAQDLLDGHARVERSVRVLKYDLHPASKLAQVLTPSFDRMGHVLAHVKRTCPLVGSIRRRMQRPSVDLPQPLSPTRPSVLALAGSSKETSGSTAFTQCDFCARRRRP